MRRATHKETGKIYAVKIMNLGSHCDEHVPSDDDDSESEASKSTEGDHTMSFEEAMNEIAMVAKLQHPNSAFIFIPVCLPAYIC